VFLKYVLGSDVELVNCGPAATCLAPICSWGLTNLVTGAIQRCKYLRSMQRTRHLGSASATSISHLIFIAGQHATRYHLPAKTTPTAPEVLGQPDIRIDCNQDWLFACARLPKRFVVWKTVSPSDISRFSVTAAAPPIFPFFRPFAICQFLISSGSLISGPRFRWPTRPQMPKVGRNGSLLEIVVHAPLRHLSGFWFFRYFQLTFCPDNLGTQTMDGCKSCLHCLSVCLALAFWPRLDLTLLALWSMACT